MVSTLIVVLSATRNLFNPVFSAPQMNHLMKKGIERFFDGIIQDLSGNVQFIGAVLLALTLDVYGHVTDQMKQESARRMDSYIKDVLGQ